jgi:transposase-like protein
MKKNGHDRGKQRFACTFCKGGAHPVHKRLKFDNRQLYCDCGRKASKNGSNRGKQRYYCTYCEKDIPYKELPEADISGILTSWIKSGKNYSVTMRENNISRYKLKKLIDESANELERIENMVMVENENRNKVIFDYWVNSGNTYQDIVANNFKISVKELRRIIANKMGLPENWNILYENRMFYK